MDVPAVTRAGIESRWTILGALFPARTASPGTP